MTLALIGIIALALVFDFINGFHDAANSIATVVSTRVLTPRIAVLWAAFFNFVAFLVFQTKVASNISKGVDPAVATLTIVAAGLVGAIVWDLLTWWWSLPTSSSHALLGGLAGAAIVKAGFGSLDAAFFLKTGLFIVISPAVGLALAVLIMNGLMYFFGARAPGRLDRVFRKLQLVSAALYSLGHGGNDAQKTMGIIVAALAAAGLYEHAPSGHGAIPLWVVLSCHAAMGLGTMSGGWRIVRTMGMRITKLAPPGGFCAETSGAASLFLATGLGVPVSTTHTITGAIVGTGSVRKLSAVRWGVAGRIVWAWILTVPGSAAIGGIAYVLARAAGISG
ncbi:MAG TPA: inorganic phosphate transporter [Candidatus Methylomirabilis sp.]|nr:inorganic phosphate transporter [Candidatus Methylomirabilis sp.]HSC71372.1 inorganic phosphate transporter [Candidatus Methylomirabilis sp.]